MAAKQILINDHRNHPDTKKFNNSKRFNNTKDSCTIHPHGAHTNAECRSQKTTTNPKLNTYTVDKKNQKLIYEKVILKTISKKNPQQVNICHLEAMIDSGASHVFMNDELAKELNLEISEASGPHITTGGGKIKSKTTSTDIQLKLQGKTVTIGRDEILIIKSDIPIILGTTGLSKLNYCIKFVNNRDNSQAACNFLMGNEEELNLKEKLLEKYPQGFSKNKFDIGCCHLKAPVIEFLNAELPSFKRYDPIPPMIGELSTQIQQFVNLQILKPSYTVRYVANTLGVKKSDGTIRMVTDFRNVNSIIVKDRYVSEKITTIMRDLQTYTVCSLLDITSAYSQVPLDDSNCDTLGCRLKSETFSYQRLPQGFCNSPSYFQRIIDHLIGNIKNVIVYQDDILVLSPDITSHTVTIETVVSILVLNGFKLNINKCQFFKEECEFLGYKLKPTGISPTEKFKLRIKTYPECNLIADLRKFRGIFNYIKHLIPNSSELMTNINTYIGNTPKKEGRTKTIIPESIKNDIKKMVQAAMETNGINFINYSKQFYLFCDGSSIGAGATLCQSNLIINTPEAHIDFKQFYAVAFYSTSWHPYQRNAPSVLYEIRAISYALSYFSEIINNCKIVILTDHRNLLSIVNSSNDYRFLKYAFNIASYNPLLVWISGTSNGTADWLSRQNESPSEPVPQQCPLYQRGGDQLLMQLQLNQKKENKNKLHEIAKHYFETYHSKSIHSNIQKIWYVIKGRLVSNNYSPREAKMILSNIRKMIDQCEICLNENIIRRRKPKSSFFTYPFEKVYTDLSYFEKIAGKPNSEKVIVISIIDGFSSYLIAGTLNNASSTSINKFFQDNLYNRFGYPAQIHSDNAKCYSDGEFAETCKKMGIIQSFSIKYSHATNQMIERSFSTLQLAIRKTCAENNTKHWRERLTWIVYQINNSCFGEESYSPNQLIYSYPHRTTVEKADGNFIQKNLMEYHGIKKEIQKLPTRKILFKNNNKKGKLGQQNSVGSTIEVLNPESTHPTYKVLPEDSTDLRESKKVSSQCCRSPLIYSSTTGAQMIMDTQQTIKNHCSPRILIGEQS
ncbi:Reverse transcriptase domain and Integrase,catalytic core domain and Ribonuclease H-like domain and Retroviral aspartyl protease domain and Aspartic peptidase domain-containing protein [Strongyloides ratti]|uniref:RNA-directed DNA polymerase n=1 Tax=Strongyloides ratti TaxID=34506 RepID=A0A090KZR0_STRRB|nr:Reverse transcriptase domain and Integrase,catalytic core domain and Ribonuclease H-like domain and Retroviral aspartyl protease domain and Aspartic peptidase domain-containing protein [Strongyloides ratti]CEF61357.1 Reverse transcriptase domain and Integrase,catalytic core domain and Ribonuclease H-like domain and Retroviral aspartyl protease domain and Aspartic peptidase domain-containing protein [Strongyloides ratti]